MSMDATLWQMHARPETEDVDPDTGEITGSSPATDRELLNMGVRVEADHPSGGEVVHVAPGAAEELGLQTDPDFTNIFNPGWSWNDLPEALREHVLEATYEEDVDGETVRRRAKVADVPDGATVVETDQPPHYWAGDR